MGFLQGVLEHLVADWVKDLIIVVAAAAMGFIKAKNYTWANTALFAFSGAAFAAMLLFAVTGHGIFESEQPNPADLVQSVKGWCADLGMGHQVVSNDASGFNFDVVEPGSSHNISVSWNSNSSPHMVQFSGSWILSKKQQEILEQLSPVNRADAIRDITLDLSRARIGHRLISVDGKLQTFDLVDSVPIDKISEGSFVKTVDEIDFGLSIVDYHLQSIEQHAVQSSATAKK